MWYSVPQFLKEIVYLLFLIFVYYFENIEEYKSHVGVNFF